MSNCPIALKFDTEVQLQSNNTVNVAYNQIRAIKRKYDQIRVNNSKYC